MDSLEIQVDVNENFINRVRRNQQATAKLQCLSGLADPRARHRGDSTADRSKGTVTVRIAIDQKDARILPEMGVRVSFLADQTQEPGGKPAGGVTCRAMRCRYPARPARSSWCAGHRRTARGPARRRQRRQYHHSNRLAAGERVAVGDFTQLKDGAKIASTNEPPRRRGRYGAWTMSEAIVRLRNVDKRYTRGKQSVEVLQGLTLDIPKGEFVALMGPSGSGKTNAAEPDRRPGHADRRRNHRSRPAPRPTGERGAGALARESRRFSCSSSTT